MVPRVGLEPTRSNDHRILSPACLPIPPPRRCDEDILAQQMNDRQIELSINNKSYDYHYI